MTKQSVALQPIENSVEAPCEQNYSINF